MFGQHHGSLNLADGMTFDAPMGRHLERLVAWRARTFEEQRLEYHDDDTPFVPHNEPARGRVRVGLLSPCLGLGGAEAWQSALADSVDRAALVWKGAVVTDGRWAVTPAMLGHLTARMPVGFGLSAARTLGAEVDVIVSWSVLDHAALFRDLDRPPRVILACHFPGEMPWTQAAELLLASVDCRVAVSELALDSLPATLRSATRVIWNAVDAARLRPTQSVALTRAAWNLPDGARVAGYLGRLAPEKDPDAMIRLAAHLPEPWHVVLVGDGREAPWLRQQLADRGLDRVRLVPGTAEVGNALAAFDTLVVPSLFESFGLTIAEGLWAGIPVIASRVGLAKLVPGLVREVGLNASGANLARAILDDAADSVGTGNRVAHARRWACDHLDLERFGRQWTNLIGDVARSERLRDQRESS